MIIDFNKLPDAARVWIYQSNTKFTAQQVVQIEKDVHTFLNAWTAHGTDLTAGFVVKYQRFIVIGLDQTAAQASGCSIDSQVRFIQALQDEYNVDLLDKMNVSYYQNDRVHYKSLLDFKKMAKDGAVGKNTIVFNNLVNTVAEFNEYWEIPASESWHSRFFK